MRGTAFFASAVSGALALILCPAAGGTLPRALQDRPNEVLGPQIHFVYAVPRDGVDRQLDSSGTIEGSVTSFLRWFARQTGGPTLRVDTYQGSLDVTFVRLAASDAAIASRGAFVRNAVEEELHGLGFNRPDTIYSVYYDGSSTYACGGAAWPPLVPGNVVVMYLHGRPPGSIPCDTQAFVGPNDEPAYWEYAMLHDTIHALGIVPTCAPHHTLSGHVSDSPSDLMYSGFAPWTFPLQLDIGHDDYYKHGHAGCLDLADSRYLTSAGPAPTLSISSFALSTPRAGRKVTARLKVELGGAPVTTAAVTCSARVRGRVLGALARRFRGSAAECTWRIPAFSRGRRLSGLVRVTSGSARVTRTFSVVVR